MFGVYGRRGGGVFYCIFLDLFAYLAGIALEDE